MSKSDIDVEGVEIERRAMRAEFVQFCSQPYWARTLAFAAEQAELIRTKLAPAETDLYKRERLFGEADALDRLSKLPSDVLMREINDAIDRARTEQFVEKFRSETLDSTLPDNAGLANAGGPEQLRREVSGHSNLAPYKFDDDWQTLPQLRRNRNSQRPRSHDGEV